MPKKKKSFINRKTAATFALVERSQQDKYAGDPDAPQHVLRDISQKKEQQKYGIFFEDDYNYLQHLRSRSVNASETVDDSSVAEPEEEAVGHANDAPATIEEDEEPQASDQEEDEDLALEDAALAGDEREAQGLRFHEELLGYDDPMFEGRVIERLEDIDEDLLEAMRQAEEGTPENIKDEADASDDEFPDDFVRLASHPAVGDGDEDEDYRPPPAQRQILDHFFESMGGDVARGLAMFDDCSDDDDDEEPRIVRQLREDRLNAERLGRGPDDYHSQCLSLQVEKLVEDAVRYDIDEIRSRLSGVSCALTESMRQAMETDRRFEEQRVVRDTETTMTQEERKEHIARTLACIREDEDADVEQEEEEEEEEDPVQAWVDFDRRPRVTESVDTPRAGYVPMDDVLGDCVVHPAAVAMRRSASREQRAGRAEAAAEAEGDAETAEGPPACRVPARGKKESADERRQRKAAVKALQRDRRATKKENKLAFKAEAVRHKSAASVTGGGAPGAPL